MNDIIINKIQSIQHGAQRAREEYRSDPAGFDADYTRQDAAMLNILRACEQAIDLANHIIKTRRLGIPASSAESFDLLQQAGVVDRETAKRLGKMTGFRNTVIHEYQRINTDVVKAVIVSGLNDLIAFGDRVMAFIDEKQSADNDSGGPATPA